MIKIVSKVFLAFIEMQNSILKEREAGYIPADYQLPEHSGTVEN